MHRIISPAVLVFLLSGSFLLTVAALAQGNGDSGSIRGVLTTDDGGALINAGVTLSRMRPNVTDPFVQRWTPVGLDGRYEIDELPEGYYRVCPAARGYLAPCRWGGVEPTVVIVSADDKSVVQDYTMRKGGEVVFRVEDPYGLVIEREPGGPGPSSNLKLGVQTQDGSVPLAKQRDPGGPRELIIPFNLEVRLWLFASELLTEDEAGRPFEGRGPHQAFAVPREEPRRIFTIRVVGRKGQRRPVGRKPVIYEDGVVSAASYGIGQEPHPRVAYRSIVSIFGENFSATVTAADQFPLPTELAGVRVLLGPAPGIPAPLFFVSPNQINFQALPGTSSSVSGGTVMPLKATLTVVAPTGQSNVADFWLTMDSPDIFTLDSSGCGPAAILNVELDGSVSLHGPENPAAPGQIISVFATGLGSLDNGINQTTVPEVPAGYPAPPGAAAELGVFPHPEFWTAGDPPFVLDTVLFAGRAPGLAGVDQYNLRIPDNAVEGCDVGFRFYYPTPLAPNTSHSGVFFTPQSQTIPLSIRRGGGRCEPRTAESLAELVWTREWLSNRDGVRAVDSLQVRLVGNRKLPLKFYEPPELTGVPTLNSTAAEDVPGLPRCDEFHDEPLDAGALTLTGPFGELVIEPDFSSGAPRYDARLPEGTLREGEYRVTAAGGADVGPFETSVEVDAPIRITSGLESADYLPAPFTVTWEGGEPDADMRFSRAEGRFAWTTVGPANRGFHRFTTFEPVETGFYFRFFLIHEAGGGAHSEFSAAGLTMGGRHRWRYVYRWESYDEEGRTIVP